MVKRKTAAEYEKEAKITPAPYAALSRPCLIHPSDVARIVYRLRHQGLNDPTMFVCHHCDRPFCIEDTHHFLGTNQDNAIDSAKKGRRSVRSEAQKQATKEALKKAHSAPRSPAQLEVFHSKALPKAHHFLALRAAKRGRK